MFRKTIIIGIAAIGVLAVGGTALADAPGWHLRAASPVANENANMIGMRSSPIIQNGQFISGQFTDLQGWQNQGPALRPRAGRRSP